MTLDITGQALTDFVDRCEKSRHSLCGDHTCRSVLEAHLSRSEDDGRPFDASLELARVAGSMPDHKWSTSALVRGVLEHLEEAPLPGGLRRGVFITTALARLGERGILADAVVRTCVGRHLVRHIVLRTASVWLSRQAGEDSPSHETYFDDLLAEIDDRALAADAHPTVHSVFVSSIQGKLGNRIERWIDEASIADIIGWNFTDYMAVNIAQADRLLPPGSDATRWIFDRFARTYLDEWKGPSLLWELVYSHNPDLIAAVAAVPRAVLAERAVAPSDVITNLEHRLTGVTVELGSEDLQTVEIFEAATRLLHEQRNDEALAIARQAADGDPNNQKMRQIYAFCLIPHHSTQARQLLDDIAIDSPLTAAVLEANRISVLLTESDFDAALELLVGGTWSDHTEGVWLWQPSSLLLGRPVVLHTSLTRWAEEARIIVSKSQPSKP
jgi:hypothetical protein